MAVVVCMCVMAVLQLAFVMHTRNILRDCASDAARYGALENRTSDDAVTRARRLIQMSTGASVLRDVSARDVSVAGAAGVEVTITAAAPVLGPLGGPTHIVAVGHGIRDAR